MRIILLLAVINLFSACGRSKGGSSGVTAPVMAAAVMDSASLPTCGDSNKNQLIYVTEEKLFKTCSGVVWEDITLPENKIAGSIFCTGELSSYGVFVSYSAALMSSGDIFVTGDITEGTIQASATNFYSHNQNGATDPGVLITYDMASPANGGYWDIKLNVKSLANTVTYYDVDVAGGKQQWTMSVDKCIVNDYR